MTLWQDLGLASGECMAWVGRFWHVAVGAGNPAYDLLSVAEQNGWDISSTPSIGSIAVFGPGQRLTTASGGNFDISSDGHAAVVTATGPGTYVISEMNGIAGYGNVDQQTLTDAGAGTAVHFVTPPSSLFNASAWQQSFGSPATLENTVTGSNTPGVATSISSSGCNTLAQSLQNASIPLVSGIPIIGNVQQALGGFFGWLFQMCVLKRIGIWIASALLILYGLKFMGHDKPIRIVQEPFRTGARLAGAMAAE